VRAYETLLTGSERKGNIAPEFDGGQGLARGPPARLLRGGVHTLATTFPSAYSLHLIPTHRPGSRIEFMGEGSLGCRQP
jgi:hypothetical protein